MNPTEKSPGIDNFLKDGLGYDRKGSIKKDVCVICHNPVDEDSFRDALSLKEYKISGMCQDCQDKIFESFQDDMIDNIDCYGDEPAF